MASIFTYQDEPPRIQSPWSTPGTSTPQPLQAQGNSTAGEQQLGTGILRLEPERQDGPTEYKLHLLLRPRRKFLSTSTTGYISGSQHYVILPEQATGGSRQLNDAGSDRPPSQPSAQARQTRLQQLTTQLLWRLQQSSPFHSSSNGDLILPVLPEATPRLGVPERPAKLLPGLEESQGALYEIGVADDGILIGLVEEELQESLGNLKAMAASLGCTTSVLRKVAVGTGEWAESEGPAGKIPTHKDTLWVAEVLVYPDSRISSDADVPKAVLDEATHTCSWEDSMDLPERDSIEQMRVTLVGATASGKSSLLGTVSTSTLDNGRGRSRLSLLKHRHEIASGITSSVAHELVGYTLDPSAGPVINYASGNVSSWTDVHHKADRLVFLSDSPGLPRFAKSALRSLVSWKPSWTLLCAAADEGPDRSDPTTLLPHPDGRADSGNLEDVDLSLSYLDLCLRLHLPMMVVITKMDLANKAGLRQVLAKLLSAVKAAGRKPVMLSNSPVLLSVSEPGAAAELHRCGGKDQVEIADLAASVQKHPGQSFVPILMTSAVTGLGIGKLHALLQTLPIACDPILAQLLPLDPPSVSSLFHIDEVFSIPPSRVYTSDTDARVARQGVVLCGYVSRGSLSVGDTVLLGPFIVDAENSPLQTSHPALRSSSYGAQSAAIEALLHHRARSYQGESFRAPTPRPQSHLTFLHVRVVSLRTLRLPVSEMQHGETGTIGVERLQNDYEMITLARARKGMVLINVGQNITAYQAFSATFPASDFARRSAPVLILGGHAIIYVNSVRAAVKVTAVAIDEDHAPDMISTASTEEAEVFRFDDDHDATRSNGAVQHINDDSLTAERKEIKLSFRFGTTVEWMEIGDQILVVPTVTAVGPVTGPTTGSHSSGLAGFVGRVCELYS